MCHSFEEHRPVLFVHQCDDHQISRFHDAICTCAVVPKTASIPINYKQV